MTWSYGRDGKRWQNMRKTCGKSWNDMPKLKNNWKEIPLEMTY